MKSLIHKFFKKEKPYNYLIAEYAPAKVNERKTLVAAREYEVDHSAPIERDEMVIDNIYQSN